MVRLCSLQPALPISSIRTHSYPLSQETKEVRADKAAWSAATAKAKQQTQKAGDMSASATATAAARKATGAKKGKAPAKSKLAKGKHGKPVAKLAGAKAAKEAPAKHTK